IVTVDGAWIDVSKRKIASLPEEILPLFMEIPKSDNFVME
ncbi:MAG: thioesterase, partial [Bacteroidales bacterium]|nr:thioesterase [Bacteroidales bacterium]